MAAFIVDYFPRSKFMAAGVLGAQATLIVEAALIANFVPSNNKNALQAAVAMFYIFQIFYGIGNDGPFLSQSPQPYSNLIHRNPILLPRRDFPHPPPCQRRLSRRRHDLLYEYYLATSRAHSLCHNRMEILPLFHNSGNDWRSVYVGVLA
jgi:hypothetical protein